MQLLHEALALLLIDDEREIEIVGRLAHQVDLLFLEQLERVPEAVEDRPDVAAEQAE